jgi:hypothetical protein
MRLRRWPLLWVGLALVGASLGVGASGKSELNPAGQVSLMVLGAAFLGAFIHSQGRGDDD